jgi:hypothetical protein
MLEVEEVTSRGLVGSVIIRNMSFRCLIRVHRPMLTSIVRRADRYTALCDDCGLPIERSEEGRWTASEPLLSRRDQAA